MRRNNQPACSLRRFRRQTDLLVVFLHRILKQSRRDAFKRRGASVAPFATSFGGQARLDDADIGVFKSETVQQLF